MYCAKKSTHHPRTLGQHRDFSPVYEKKTIYTENQRKNLIISMVLRLRCKKYSNIFNLIIKTSETKSLWKFNNTSNNTIRESSGVYLTPFQIKIKLQLVSLTYVMTEKPFKPLMPLLMLSVSTFPVSAQNLANHVWTTNGIHYNVFMFFQPAQLKFGTLF